MKKDKMITLRVSEKTEETIKNIRKQMIELHGFTEEELTDSFIIRHAINTLNEKVKYFLYEDKIDYYKNKNKQ